MEDGKNQFQSGSSSMKNQSNFSQSGNKDPNVIKVMKKRRIEDVSTDGTKFVPRPMGEKNLNLPQGNSRNDPLRPPSVPTSGSNFINLNNLNLPQRERDSSGVKIMPQTFPQTFPQAFPPSQPMSSFPGNNAISGNQVGPGSARTDRTDKGILMVNNKQERRPSNDADISLRGEDFGSGFQKKSTTSVAPQTSSMTARPPSAPSSSSHFPSSTSFSSSAFNPSSSVTFPSTSIFLPPTSKFPSSLHNSNSTTSHTTSHSAHTTTTASSTTATTTPSEPRQRNRPVTIKNETSSLHTQPIAGGVLVSGTLQRAKPGPKPKLQFASDGDNSTVSVKLFYLRITSFVFCFRCFMSINIF